MVLPTQPYYNEGVKYVNGYEISWDSETILTIYPGACRDSTNRVDIVNNSILQLNGLQVGPNGCDIGPFQPDTIYAIYIINDSRKYQPVASLLSSQTIPVLPSGYDSYRRIGWARTVPTTVVSLPTVHFLRYFQDGQGQSRTYYIEPAPLIAPPPPPASPDYPFFILEEGVETSYTPLFLNNAIPNSVGIIPTQIILQSFFQSEALGAFAELAPFSWRHTNGLISVRAQGAASAQNTVVVTVPTYTDFSGSFPEQKILYKVTEGSPAPGTPSSLTLRCIGFYDYLL